MKRSACLPVILKSTNAHFLKPFPPISENSFQESHYKSYFIFRFQYSRFPAMFFRFKDSSFKFSCISSNLWKKIIHFHQFRWLLFSQSVRHSLSRTINPWHLIKTFLTLWGSESALRDRFERNRKPLLGIESSILAQYQLSGSTTVEVVSKRS